MSKTLIFTDIHFGINSDKPSRQKIAANVVDEIVQACEINGIDRILFLGDLFHHRTSIEVSTLNLADAAVTKLSSVAELTLIQGNHDLYERSGLSQSSTAIFAKHKAKIIARPTEITLNNKHALLIPWCGDGRGMNMGEFFNACGFKPTQSKYDMILGHVNITDGSDLVKAHSKVLELLKDETVVGELLGASAAAISPRKDFTQAQELFLLTHPFSQVFLGHVHEHQELILGKRLFYIVGSPQMQTHDLKGLDPNRKRHGYYILDDNNAPQFFECQSAPKFVTVYASEIKNPTKDTKAKLEALKGCIVKRCYDCALTEQEQKAFDEAVVDNSPLEEDSAVFMDAASETVGGTPIAGAQEMESLLNMSKEEYLKQVSDSLVKESLSGKEPSQAELERRSKALFDKLMGYYGMVTR